MLIFRGVLLKKLPQSRGRLMNGRCRRKPRVVVLGWSFMTVRQQMGGTGRALEVPTRASIFDRLVVYEFHPFLMVRLVVYEFHSFFMT